MKDYADRLVGVDLSEKMVSLAKKKMIYDDVQVMVRKLTCVNADDKCCLLTLATGRLPAQMCRRFL
jgi:predicted TPR repeat methyltransferase